MNTFEKIFFEFLNTIIGIVLIFKILTNEIQDLEIEYDEEVKKHRDGLGIYAYIISILIWCTIIFLIIKL